MKFKIEKVKKKHFNSVIKIIEKNISKFVPKKKDHEIIWKNFSSQKNLYAIVVLLDQKVVGYGSIFFAKKIRGGTIGYIEDIVVDKKFQFRGLGQKIVKELTEFGKKIKCYKIVLQCVKKKNIKFYKKNKYDLNGFVLQKNFIIKD